MREIIRDRRLTPEEAAKYRAIREDFEARKDEIVRQIYSETPGPGSWKDVDELRHVIRALRVAREALGMSREDVAKKSLLKAGELADLEEDRMYNPPVSVLSRYAAAVGQHLVLALTVQQAPPLPPLAATSAVGVPQEAAR